MDAKRQNSGVSLVTADNLKQPLRCLPRTFRLSIQYGITLPSKLTYETRITFDKEVYTDCQCLMQVFIVFGQLLSKRQSTGIAYMELNCFRPRRLSKREERRFETQLFCAKAALRRWFYYTGNSQNRAINVRTKRQAGRSYQPL